MELTQEQIEAIAKGLAENLKPSEDEPDWIKDIRRISAEEGGKNKKEVEDLVNQRIGEYIMPMVKQSAMSAYLDGLEPEYHEVLKEQLKDEYEKNPEGLFRAGQHDLTRRMVQNSARWEGQQRKAAEEAAKKAAGGGAPGQEEVITGSPERMDRQGENLSRMLQKAGINKSSAEVMEIVTKEVVL